MMKLASCTVMIAAGMMTLGVGARQAPAAAGHQHMEHRFDNPAQYAAQFDDPARDGWQMPDRVLAALGLSRGQAVADIGAGTGYFSVRLAKLAAAPTVYAVDIEPSMVEHLRARAAREGLANVVPVRASESSANLPAAVDVALVVDTFHHIPNRVDYFRRLQSSLKPGARLAIVDFRKDSPTGPPPEFRFTADQITAELREAGYTLTASHDFLPRQLFLVYSVR